MDEYDLYNQDQGASNNLQRLNQNLIEGLIIDAYKNSHQIGMNYIDVIEMGNLPKFDKLRQRVKIRNVFTKEQFMIDYENLNQESFSIYLQDPQDTKLIEERFRTYYPFQQKQNLVYYQPNYDGIQELESLEWVHEKNMNFNYLLLLRVNHFQQGVFEEINQLKQMSKGSIIELRFKVSLNLAMLIQYKDMKKFSNQLMKIGTALKLQIPTRKMFKKQKK
ncbi:UNKNOWN [Stylonychia lemnae]|uniref:Uncharacterized protein n=1 Tax=Stylonychia lemnae TaxID=5949 RepID=A0A078AM74_STYLE|nr:UNKNOWN [Stylonychia lemnae]|eukprot:CDW83490.1 UNKNOWN [Stylonychia lemnae]